MKPENLDALDWLTVTFPHRYLDVTWDDDSTDVISCLSGNAFNIKGCKTVEITAGTFHLA